MNDRTRSFINWCKETVDTWQDDCSALVCVNHQKFSKGTHFRKHHKSLSTDGWTICTKQDWEDLDNEST